MPSSPSKTCPRCCLVHAADLESGDSTLHACLIAQQEAMITLLRLVAFEVRPCRGCGIPIYHVTHVNGKKGPYTAAGLNHFIDCPKADQFRKTKKAPIAEEP